MDFVSELTATASTKSGASGGSLLEYLLGVGLAMAVLRMEVRRHAAGLPRLEGGRTGEGYGASCKKILRLYAPEATGVAACFALAVALRFGSSAHTVLDEKTWEQIMRDWPILLTADSLLSLQAMLRFLVLASNVFRAVGGTSPLSQEASAIFCGAAVARAVLVMRTDAYMLDGPLGGYLPVAFELLSVPLLAMLSRGINRNALAASLVTLVVAARIASRNRFALSGDEVCDALFVFAHLAELFAAFAYLSRALLLDTASIGGKSSIALRFSHIVMPVQQCLSAYYFVQAFEFAPGLVGAGNPFEIAQVGGITQLGAYAAAAVIYLAEYLESPAEGEAEDHVDEMPHEGQWSAIAAPQRVAVSAIL